MSSHWNIKQVGPDDWHALQAFYRRNRYKGRPTLQENIWCALENTQWLAAARLTQIGGHPVLRGVWVDQHYRQQGVGRFLLEQLIARECLQGYYCFAEAALLPFYQRAGFQVVMPAQIPLGLQRAYQRYNRHAEREPVYLLLRAETSQSVGHSRNTAGLAKG